MSWLRGLGRGVLAAAAVCGAGAIETAAAGDADTAPRRVVTIPKVDRPPALDDFDGMRPGPAVEGSLARVEGFTQLQPVDGDAATQRTEVMLGYDDDNLYVVFLAFDDRPELIRARMASRERTDGDDQVTVTLDTFADQRRGYGFVSNPLGIQQDFFETDERGRDRTFDTVWRSEGRVTPEGYVVVMAIPFRSVRFPASESQTWGILLERWVARAGEWDFWPRVSASVQGRLGQQARLEGIRGISPGRTMQFIPYVSFRSVRALDTRDPLRPVMRTDRGTLDGGVDAKFVVKNTLVLDVTLNPDFSQVESDEPQQDANARFELFVPEKRPFFLENADFFQTPLDLVFTRRIADPQVGARLTGKIGPYGVGALVIDDQAPGRVVPEGDPREGARAGVAVVRVTRDLFDQSRVGVLFTDRELDGGFNRVAGVDARVRFDEHWSGDFQAVTSATRRPDGSTSAGPAYRAFVSGSGRHYYYEAGYRDVSRGFESDLGFVPRRDIRSFGQYGEYLFRPEGKYFVTVSPRAYAGNVWSHDGTLVDWERSVGLEATMRRQTSFGAWTVHRKEGLRPSEYAALDDTQYFSYKYTYAFFDSQALGRVGVRAEMRFGGTAINFRPAAATAPEVAGRPFDGIFTATLRPVDRLRVDTTWLLTRLTDRSSGAGIFVNHVLRSKWSWQFTRELSVRAIVQWDMQRANPGLTSRVDSRRINGDLLVTWQVNPWTALHAGYNGNLRRLDGRDGLFNDSNQLFVKFAYLFRP
jgi:hypothetical protein